MKVAIAVLGVVWGAAVWAQAEAPGKAVFEKRCGGCHALDRDKEGPRLAGIVGRRAGSTPSFAYSDALKNSALTWDDATLDRWLTDSEKLVPGSDMTIRVPSAEERAAIIAWLKQSGAGHRI